MKTLPLAEAKAKLSRLVDRVAAMDEQVLITRNGRPAAALVSPDEYEGWKETRRRGLRQLKKTGKIYTLEELIPGE